MPQHSQQSDVLTQKANSRPLRLQAQKIFNSQFEIGTTGTRISVPEIVINVSAGNARCAALLFLIEWSFVKKGSSGYRHFPLGRAMTPAPPLRL